MTVSLSISVPWMMVLITMRTQAATVDNRAPTAMPQKSY